MIQHTRPLWKLLRGLQLEKYGPYLLAAYTLIARHCEINQPFTSNTISLLLTLQQLVFHPEHRITVDEALEHAYLADLHGQVSRQDRHTHTLKFQKGVLTSSLFGFTGTTW